MYLILLQQNSYIKLDYHGYFRPLLNKHYIQQSLHTIPRHSLKQSKMFSFYFIYSVFQLVIPVTIFKNETSDLCCCRGIRIIMAMPSFLCFVYTHIFNVHYMYSTKNPCDDLDPDQQTRPIYTSNGAV